MTVYIDKRYFNETSFKRDLFSTLLQEDLFSNQVSSTKLKLMNVLSAHWTVCSVDGVPQRSAGALRIRSPGPSLINSWSTAWL